MLQAAGPRPEGLFVLAASDPAYTMCRLPDNLGGTRLLAEPRKQAAEPQRHRHQQREHALRSPAAVPECLLCCSVECMKLTAAVLDALKHKLKCSLPRWLLCVCVGGCNVLSTSSGWTLTSSPDRMRSTSKQHGSRGSMCTTALRHEQRPQVLGH